MLHRKDLKRRFLCDFLFLSQKYRFYDPFRAYSRTRNVGWSTLGCHCEVLAPEATQASPGALKVPELARNLKNPAF